MRQLKFFMAALMAVVMSVSVSSCMNGDDNTQFTVPFLGKIEMNNLTYFTMKTMDGYTIQTRNMPTNLVSVGRGDFVYMVATYDSSVDIKEAQKTFTVTVEVGEIISGDHYEVSEIEKANDDTQYASDRGVTGPPFDTTTNTAASFMFDRYTLVLPIGYYYKDKSELHNFSLVYYTDESEVKGKSDLKLYLRHTSREVKEEEKTPIFSYRTFDITNVLNNFMLQNDGKEPTNIIIVTEKNVTNNDVPSQTTDASMKYEYLK